MVLSVGLAVGSWYVARGKYGPSRAPTGRSQEATLPLFRGHHNKYWVDEIYQATIIGWALKLRPSSRTWCWVVDGLVTAPAFSPRAQPG